MRRNACPNPIRTDDVQRRFRIYLRRFVLSSRLPSKGRLKAVSKRADGVWRVARVVVIREDHDGDILCQSLKHLGYATDFKPLVHHRLVPRFRYLFNSLSSPGMGG